MVWRGKGRRKAARALKEAGGGPGGAGSAGSPAPRAKSPTPLPKGRPSGQRDGGGRRGRGGRGGEDDDDRRERGRMARPQSSPAPFIIAGAFVLGAIVIVAIVASSGNEPRHRAETTSGSSSGGGYSSSGGGSGSAAYPAGGSSSSPAPARPRGGSAAVEIRAVHRGLSRSGDERGWTAACGRCGTRFTSRVETCPNATCGAALRWDTRKRIKCEFCCPTNKLTVADLNEIPENDRQGFCAFCGGSGKDPDYKADSSYIAFGLTRDGTGDGVKPGGCVICKGSGKCMQCVGDGWVEMPESFLP